MSQYFINPSGGNDNNSGLSTSQAWRTMSKAQSSAGAGDVIDLMAGNYGNVTWRSTSNRGTSSNWIIFRQWAGHSNLSAIFESVWFNSGINYYIEIQGCQWITSYNHQYAARVERDSSNVIFRRCYFRGAGNSITTQPVDNAVSFSDCSYCHLYDSIVWRQHRGAQMVGGARYCSFVGNDFSEMQSSCCSVGSYMGEGHGGTSDDGTHDNLIAYNTIHSHTSYTGHGGSGIANRARNLIIRGNVFYNFGSTRPIRNYQDVYHVSGYPNITVENNVVYFFAGDLYNQAMWWVEMLDCGENFIMRNNTFLKYYNSAARAQSGVSITYATSSWIPTWKIYNNIFETKLELWATSSMCSNIQQGNNIFNTDPQQGLLINGSRQTSFPGGNNGSTWRSNFNVGSMFAEREQAYPFGAIYPFELCSGSPAINAGNTGQAPALDLLQRGRSGAADIGAYEYGGPVEIPLYINVDDSISVADYDYEEPPAGGFIPDVNVSDDISIAETVTVATPRGGTYQVDVADSISVAETVAFDIAPKKLVVIDSVSVDDVDMVATPLGETPLKWVVVSDTINIEETLPDRYVFGPLQLTVNVADSIDVGERIGSVNESLFGGGWPNWYLATTDAAYADGKAYDSADAGQNWNEVSPADADFSIRIYGLLGESEPLEISVVDSISIAEPTLTFWMNNPDLSSIPFIEPITIVETALVETLYALYDQLIDSISVAEAVSVVSKVLYHVDVSDSISVADTLAAAKSLNVNVVDFIDTQRDIVVLLLSLNASVNDSISIAESVNGFIPLLYASAVDTINIVETAIAQRTDIKYPLAIDAVSIAETVTTTKHGGEYNLDVADSISIADSVASKLTRLHVNAVDTISIAESNRVAKSLSVDVADSISVGKTIDSYLLALNVSVTDAVSVADSVERVATNPIKLEHVESVAVQDSAYRVNVNPISAYHRDRIYIYDFDMVKKVAIPESVEDLIGVGETVDLVMSKPGFVTDEFDEVPIHPRDVRFS
jgi:hypothetical protein